MSTPILMDAILEVSPEFLEHQTQKEKRRQNRQNRQARQGKERSKWGDEREDEGYPDYDY